MQIFTLKRQRFLATCICYMASWLGLGLAGMWIWLGSLASQPHVLLNPIFNPTLILDGLLVAAASIMIAFKNKFAVVAITIYALAMEAFLQIYQINTGTGFKPKPYFAFELAGLMLANIGVFWWHYANNKMNEKKTKKHKR